MGQRRHAAADEPGESSRRLSRLVGASVAGWTPQQPQEPDRPTRPPDRQGLLAARPQALGWLVVVGLVAVLASGWVLSRHHNGNAAAAAALPVASSAPLPVPSTTSGGMVVDVGGRVRHPGLVTLPPGSRVADAIAAAGGALRPGDLATMNLAARVTDGQLLLVGVPGAVGGSSGTGATSPSGPLDLNSATVEQLDALPGVGPVLAQRIVDWRTAHGGFHSVDDLQQVSGIGARKFDDLKALVTA